MQTYASTVRIPKKIVDRTSSLLHSLEYSHTDILIAEELPTLIEKAGFSVERFSSVHDMYVEDNLCMLQEVHHNWDSLHKQNGRESTLLLKLLEWERFLFQERYWTGVVLYARKR